MAVGSGERVLLECYATWCPPCRAAAPRLAELSTLFECRFVRVDVDAARDVSDQLGVTVMPTFLLFGSPAFGCPHIMQLSSCMGWSEEQLVTMLESHGVPRVELSAEQEAHCQLVPESASARV